MLADFVKVFDEDASYFEDGSWGGVNGSVGRLDDDFAFNIIDLSALQGDDPVGVDWFVCEPAVFFDHTDDVVIADPGGSACAEQCREYWAIGAQGVDACFGDEKFGISKHAWVLAYQGVSHFD